MFSHLAMCKRGGLPIGLTTARMYGAEFTAVVSRCVNNLLGGDLAARQMLERVEAVWEPAVDGKAIIMEDIGGGQARESKAMAIEASV